MEVEKERLVEENINLVHYVVRKYFFQFVGDEDIFQIGCIGLMRAADKFDTSRGMSFSTLAVTYVKGDIMNHLRESYAHKRVVANHSVSLQGLVCGKFSGKESTLEDMIQDDFNLEDSICDKILIQDLLDKSDITEQQKQCLFSYYIDGLTQKQISKALRVSQPVICRELARATKIIRKNIA